MGACLNLNSIGAAYATACLPIPGINVHVRFWHLGDQVVLPVYV